jgi:large subunit ribosomal protein L3
MGQTFVQEVRVPVTYVKAGPCFVTQIKTKDADGYWAVQLGFGDKRIKNVTKPLQGHLKGAIKDKRAPRYLREVLTKNKPDLKVGDKVHIGDIFKVGDVISVTGVSKGKGFAGVVKRWKFAGGPRTHGQSDRLRAPGSIGQGTTPGRVHKGKKMAGRMGTQKVTVKNLRVVDVNEKDNELLLSGPVPGVFGSLVVIVRLASGKLSDFSKEVKEVVQQVEEEEDADVETKQSDKNVKKSKGEESE